MSGHPPSQFGTVYFVRRADGQGPIKIGFSMKPWVRFDMLDCASPYPLDLCATFECLKVLEFSFHHRFFDAHLRGEWFNPSPDLLAVIDQINAGTFDPETLPASLNVTAMRRRPKGPWTEEQKLRVRELRRQEKAQREQREREKLERIEADRLSRIARREAAKEARAIRTELEMKFPPSPALGG